MYKIDVRYEYMGAEGKTWFSSMSCGTFERRYDAEKEMKFLIESTKKDKYKHEYRIVEEA